MNRGKKALKVFLILLLIITASVLFYFGFYFNNLSKPKSIFDISIDNISKKMVNYTSFNSKYLLGDNFTINGNVKFDFSSEKYVFNSTNVNDLKTFNLINNLNKSNFNYSFIQDKKNKKLLIDINDSILNEEVFHNKYLVENSTEYYFVSSVLNNYVNNGNCNYFENLSEETTTRDNISYLYNFIINSLKNNLDDSYFERHEVKKNISSSEEEVYQMSLSIDNDRMNNIIGGIFNDLVNDKTADKILTNINENFNRTHVGNRKYLSNNESYVINIYVSKSMYKPLMYEFIHMNNDKKKIVSYESNSDVGTLYYMEDSNLKYIGSTIIHDNSISIKFSDGNNNNIGTFKFEKSSNSFNLNLLFNFNNRTYDGVVSSKFIKYSKSGYTNEVNMSMKISDNLVTILSGNIKMNNKISNKAIIHEDTSNAILNSSLSNEQVAARDKQFSLVKERFFRQ